MKRIAIRVLPVVIASLLIGHSAFATDGYFLTGYGTRAEQQGQGGAGVAKPGDSLAGATNPAGLLLVGNRFDIGLTLFRPNAQRNHQRQHVAAWVSRREWRV
jgi:long-chain fatty acid transport protein